MNLTKNLTLPTIADPEFVFWFAFSATESLIGFILYIGFAIVFLREPKVRGGSGLLIGHLMLTQALICTWHFLVFTIVTFTARIAPTSEQTCRHLHFFYWLTFFSANYSTLLLAINRLVALLYPHRYRFLAKLPLLVSCILLSWLIATALCIPFYFGYGTHFGVMQPLGSCGAVTHPGYGYLIVSTLGMILPVGLSLVIYVVLFSVLFCGSWRSQRTIQVGAMKGLFKNSPLRKRRLSVTKILFAAAVWDLICIVPIPIVGQWWPQIFYGHPYVQLWLRTLLFSASVPCPVRSISCERIAFLESYFRRRSFSLSIRITVKACGICCVALADYLEGERSTNATWFQRMTF